MKRQEKREKRERSEATDKWQFNWITVGIGQTWTRETKSGSMAWTREKPGVRWLVPASHPSDTLDKEDLTAQNLADKHISDDERLGPFSGVISNDRVEAKCD